MVLLSMVPANAQGVRKAVNRLASTAAGNVMRQAVNNTRAIAQNASQQGGSAYGGMMLPNVSTASVDLNTCDMDFIGGKSRPSAGPGGGGGGDSDGGVDTSGYPPKPGPDYQPMTQHGQFVGWYSPEEVALSQTDFPAALVSILKSDRYYGGISGAASILYEIGMISSPFAFDEAAAFLGK
jgi:hypothetical protein